MDYGKKWAERPIVTEWLRKWRSDPGDLILKDYPFKKKDPAAPSYEWGNDPNHTADLLLVGQKLIAVVFIHNLHYSFVENWKERQKYFTFFDEVWVCVTTRNFANLYNNTDRRFGIFIANGTQTLAVVRYPKLGLVGDKDKIDLAKLLSVVQIKALLDGVGVKYVKKAGKPALLAHIPSVEYEDVKAAVVKSIKEKKTKKPA